MIRVLELVAAFLGGVVAAVVFLRAQRAHQLSDAELKRLSLLANRLDSMLSAYPNSVRAHRVSLHRGFPTELKASVIRSVDSPIRLALGPAASTPTVEPPESPPSSFINAEFERHGKGRPILVRHSYTLAFWTGTASPDSLLHDVPLQYEFAPGEDGILATVELQSDDFDIKEPVQVLTIRSDGVSRGRARFEVIPLHDGPRSITAVFLKERNLIQKLEMTVNVEMANEPAIGAVTATGRTTVPSNIQRRDMNITFWREGDGFRVYCGGDSRPAWGRITLNEAGLANIAGAARAALDSVVDTVSSGARVYDGRGAIPRDIAAESLRAVAVAGDRLFRDLFFGEGADRETQRIGSKLLNVMKAPGPLRIQIATNQIFLPWSMLYIVDDFNGTPVAAENFLGFRHIVEQVPLTELAPAFDQDIRRAEKLTIGFDVNPDIDAALNVDAVKRQRDFWNSVVATGTAAVTVRETADAVRLAIAPDPAADQLTYCYCHAAAPLDSTEARDESKLVFAQSAALTLRGLRDADRKPAVPFTTAPLFFINACESAKLSPFFYSGFVPYLLAKGARGVIGAECAVPANFGQRWAARFFSGFLAGGEVGDVVHDLRRRFWSEENNLLGLLYTLYCNVNTRVDPALGAIAAD